MAFKLGDSGQQARVSALMAKRAGRVRRREQFGHEDEMQERQLDAAEKARKEEGSFENVLKRAFATSLGRLPGDIATAGLGGLVTGKTAAEGARTGYYEAASAGARGAEGRTSEDYEAWKRMMGLKAPDDKKDEMFKKLFPGRRS